MGALPESQVQAFVDKLIAARARPQAHQVATVRRQRRTCWSRQTPPSPPDRMSRPAICIAVLEQDQTNVKATGFVAPCSPKGGGRGAVLMEQVPEELLAQPEIIDLPA